MTRWMYPPELDRQVERDRFDPISEGLRHGLPRELSLAIWERVCADATDNAGRCDIAQAQHRFHELARRIAARNGRLRPDIGRLTRVGVELEGATPAGSVADELRPRTPGRETLAAVEARRWAHKNGEPTVARDDPRTADGFDRADAATARPDPPGIDDVMLAIAALQLPARQDDATPQSAAIRNPMSRLLDVVPRPGTVAPGREVSTSALPAAAIRSAARAIWARPATSASAALKRRHLGPPQPEHSSDDSIDALRAKLGSGRALDDAVRRRMEVAFAASFEDVRIHTDAAAGRLSEHLGARAATLGRDIVVGADEPLTDQLLAHELTHVLQSRSGTLGPGITPADHPAEVQADQAAAEIANGQVIATHSLLHAPSSLSLARKVIENGAGNGVASYQLTQEGNACGTTSTAMILSWLGFTANQADVDAKIRSNPDFVDMFTSPRAIIRMLSDFGTVGTGFNNNEFSHIKQNIDNNIPMIAIIDADRKGGSGTAGLHYVVIDGYDDEPGAEQINIVNPWGTSGMEDLAAFNQKAWENLQFPWPIPLGMNRYYITVGKGGVGGNTQWADIAPTLVVAEGASRLIEGLARIIDRKESWDEFLNTLTTGTVQVLIAIAETILGGVSFIAQTIGRWMQLISATGYRLIKKGGAANIAGGLGLLILGAPFWLAGKIIDLGANLVGAISGLIAAPFNWFLDWLSTDDRARELVAKRAKDGTLTSLNEQTVTKLLGDLMSGFCGDADEKAILRLLHASTVPGASATMQKILTPEMRKRLYSAVDGDEFHEMVRLIAQHMGNDVRAEIIDMLMSGRCATSHERSIRAIIEKLSDADARAVLTPGRRKNMYAAIDGAEFTGLIRELFKRFAELRVEVFERLLDTACGDDREKLILEMLETRDFDAAGFVRSEQHRKLLFHRMDGANFMSLLRLMGRLGSDTAGFALDRLLGHATHNAEEKCCIDIINGLADPATVLTPQRRARLYDSIDGDNYNELMRTFLAKFPVWRGEVIDRMLDGRLGAERQNVILRAMYAGDFNLDGILGGTVNSKRRNAMYNGFGGAQYQALCQWLGKKLSALADKVEVVTQLLKNSRGDASIVEILTGLDDDLRRQVIAQVGAQRFERSAALKALLKQDAAGK